MIKKRNSPPLGATTQVTSEVDAKGGTNRPRRMPIVLGASILAALVGMGVAWGFIV